MEQLQVFIVKGKEENVYKLKKMLCRLNYQVPKAWYSQIDCYFLLKKDFKSKSEPTLHVKHQVESNVFIVTLYVDEFIFI